MVLAGQDRRGTELPPAGAGRHPLHGYKGADLRVDGVPLVRGVIERLRAAGAFDPVLVIGPRSVYESLVPSGVRIVDADGTFGENLRAAVEALEPVLAPTLPGEGCAVFSTCDLVPDPAEVRALLADLEAHRPLDFWMPQVRVPADQQALGSSDWKPEYRLRPEPGAPAEPILPGHLLACDPRVVRREFVYRILDVFYRTRNRPLAERRRVVLGRLLVPLLLEDLGGLLRGRRPISPGILRHGLAVARRLEAGEVSTRDMEHHLRHVFIERVHRRRHPEDRTRVTIVDALSIARDIDTQEEARELVSETTS